MPLRRRTAIVVTTRWDSPTCDELARLADSGERPRRDYVELAKLVDGDVIDSHYMRTRATSAARYAAAKFGLPLGQVLEVLAVGQRYEHICAWADRLGLPLALLHKVGRLERDLVLISVWLSSRQKAPFLRELGVHSHLRAIVNYGSAQAEIAATRLGVPRSKLHLALQPVDERFWIPRQGRVSEGKTICAVGWEHRDYPTLIEAVRGTDIRLEIAVGTVTMFEPVFTEGKSLPPNVIVHHKLSAPDLRDLYARSRLVVIPVQDVEFDAGVTAMGEAMAMSRPLIVTKTRGQGDTLVHGVHGFYVPPADVASMRSAINAVLADELAAEAMGRAGRALVEGKLTLDRYVRQLASLILDGSSA